MLNKIRFCHVCLIIILAILCLGPSRTVSAGYNTWTSIGPWGGEITALAIDPQTPTTLYAGTGGSGIYHRVSFAGPSEPDIQIAAWGWLESLRAKTRCGDFHQVGMNQLKKIIKYPF